jgi:hypothetical protein
MKVMSTVYNFAAASAVSRIPSRANIISRQKIRSAERKRFWARIGHQGCQMAEFHTKNPNLGIFASLGMLVYFVAIWNILLQFGKFYGHLV